MTNYGPDFNPDFGPGLKPTTAGDILTLALFDAGIVATGQVPNAQDSNNALTRLNYMLAEWEHQRWLVWHLLDLSIVSTGAQSYSVGPGGDIDIVRAPDRLEAAFFRQLVQSQPNQIDYPLDILQSREDYNLIALKNLRSFPMTVFYDSSFPLGRVYPWPIMQPNIYELHLSVKEVLSQIPLLNTVLTFPAEYYNAILYNMAVRLRQAYDLPEQPSAIALAKKSLNVIRGANTQIARLQMPTDLQRPGIYNPYSDQVR